MKRAKKEKFSQFKRVPKPIFREGQGWTREFHNRMHEVWENNIYIVLVEYLDLKLGKGGPVHIWIRLKNGRPLRSWYHWQLIKNAVCGEEREGVELFPKQSRLVDDRNFYHIWVLPEGETYSQFDLK